MRHFTPTQAALLLPHVMALPRLMEQVRDGTIEEPYADCKPYMCLMVKQALGLYDFVADPGADNALAAFERYMAYLEAETWPGSPQGYAAEYRLARLPSVIAEIRGSM